MVEALPSSTLGDFKALVLRVLCLDERSKALDLLVDDRRLQGEAVTLQELGITAVVTAVVRDVPPPRVFNKCKPSSGYDELP